MFNNLLFLLGTPAGGAGGQQSGSPLTSLAPLLLIGLIMYFLMIRPQSKKQKAMKNMLANLAKGDAVITIGGIHGTVVEVKERTVIIKVDGETKLEFNKEAVATVVNPQAASEPVDKKAIKDKKDSKEAKDKEEKK